MVMSGSQPMTLVLCQLVPYPPLEKNDEHKVRNILSTMEDIPYLFIEDLMDNVSSNYEVNDRME